MTVNKIQHIQPRASHQRSSLRVLVGLMALLLASSSWANGFRNNLSIDLVGIGTAQPNISYERTAGNHISFGSDFSFDALNIDDGVVFSPYLRFYPIGALREGFVLQAGARLPTENDILAEAGLGYAYWVDRMHLTPVGKIRHDGSWQVRLELGYGWY
ncbi:MAG: hypothetical protein WED11_09475 [Natronospirillum sp.]